MYYTTSHKYNSLTEVRLRGGSNHIGVNPCGCKGTTIIYITNIL